MMPMMISNTKYHLSGLKLSLMLSFCNSEAHFQNPELPTTVFCNCNLNYVKFIMLRYLVDVDLFNSHSIRSLEATFIVLFFYITPRALCFWENTGAATFHSYLVIFIFFYSLIFTMMSLQTCNDLRL
ncbi:hypothetical protein S245_002921 [Arachis hypogaea]|nr:uncharacterized protein DS421_1g28090 [Arachis hypogaea]